MSAAALRIAFIAVLWAAAVLDVMKPGMHQFLNPLQQQPKPDIPIIPFI